MLALSRIWVIIFGCWLIGLIGEVDRWPGKGGKGDREGEIGREDGSTQEVRFIGLGNCQLCASACVRVSNPKMKYDWLIEIDGTKMLPKQIDEELDIKVTTEKIK